MRNYLTTTAALLTAAAVTGAVRLWLEAEAASRLVRAINARPFR